MSCPSLFRLFLFHWHKWDHRHHVMVKHFGLFLLHYMLNWLVLNWLVLNWLVLYIFLLDLRFLFHQSVYDVLNTTKFQHHFLVVRSTTQIVSAIVHFLGHFREKELLPDAPLVHDFFVMPLQELCILQIFLACPSVIFPRRPRKPLLTVIFQYPLLLVSFSSFLHAHLKKKNNFINVQSGER